MAPMCSASKAVFIPALLVTHEINNTICYQVK